MQQLAGYLATRLTGYPVVPSLASGFSMPAEDVVKVFKRFDKDGNGAITRKELSEVLTALNPQVWDSATLERLMAPADKNGDGVLQLEEFVHWLYAALAEDVTLDSKPSKASKEQMMEDIFRFFDEDEDGYWSFQEASACQLATEGESMMMYQYDLLMDAAGVPPEERAKGFPQRGVCDLYLHPSFGMDVVKDHALVFGKVRLAEEIFEHFDVDRDGYWNYEEYSKCLAAVSSRGEVASQAIFTWLLDQVHLLADDVPGRGLAKKDVVKLYTSPKFCDLDMDVAKEHAKVFPGAIQDC